MQRLQKQQLFVQVYHIDIALKKPNLNMSIKISVRYVKDILI